MSKSRSVLFVTASVAGLLLLGAGVLILGKGVDDQRMIREAVTEAVLASKDGRPGGVLDNVSVELKINDQQAGGGREISDVVKRFKPDVEIPAFEAKIFGEDATISTPVKLTIGILGARQSFDLKAVTILLKREDARKWLVIPTHKWRVSEVKVPADVLPTGFPGLPSF